MSYKDAGVVFLAAFYMSDKESIKHFEEQNHLTFPVGTANGVARELRVETIPETIFISREGKVVKRIRGKMSAQDLTSAVGKILE